MYIWFTNVTLTGSTFLSQNEPGSNCIEWLLHTPQNCSSEVPLCSLESYQDSIFFYRERINHFAPDSISIFKSPPTWLKNKENM